MDRALSKSSIPFNEVFLKRHLAFIWLYIFFWFWRSLVQLFFVKRMITFLLKIQCRAFYRRKALQTRVCMIGFLVARDLVGLNLWLQHLIINFLFFFFYAVKWEMHGRLATVAIVVTVIDVLTIYLKAGWFFLFWVVDKDWKNDLGHEILSPEQRILVNYFILFFQTLYLVTARYLVLVLHNF